MIHNIYPFTIRLQSGREVPQWAEDAADAAVTAAMRHGEPVVLVLRADEPLVRPRRPIVARLLHWWLDFRGV